ncbi:MAG: 16S rRNA (guanine(527)-N(7))-methyltransferase RsmG [Herbinix sp.]|nr:16S rRNA (guanine(527)-N(7))-methyltransferase RsmG [Herbinix sp.]
MNDKQYAEFDVFQNMLDKLNITLTEGQKQQFMDYYELLIEWNKVMNLTAITTLSDVVIKHFVDSLTLAKIIRPTSEKILDIGTGAGFPGIPLKIVFPDTNIVLLDSLNKRLQFLNEVISKLGMKNIITLHGRAEDYGRDPEYREQFDLCVSRAVAKLSSLSEYCIPYVKKGGFFISYKSGNIDEELESSQRAIKLLGAKVEQVSEFILPDTDIGRTLVVLKKTEHTPKIYPRSAGKPSKEPL